MQAQRIAVRGSLALAAATCAVGLIGATAWASTPSGSDQTLARHIVTSHSAVTVKQCRAGHGHVVHQQGHSKDFVCKGGKLGGRSIKFG